MSLCIRPLLGETDTERNHRSSNGRVSYGNGFPDVVVTGIAMTTALASDVDSTWKKLLDGQSGIRKLETRSSSSTTCLSASAASPEDFDMS